MKSKHTIEAIVRQVADVPHARLWVASVKAPDATKTLFIECERWCDARHVARMRLGAEVDITALDPATIPSWPTPRLQVKWVGSAAGRVPDLRMQVRQLEAFGKASAWKDLHG